MKIILCLCPGALDSSGADSMGMCGTIGRMRKQKFLCHE